MIDAAWILRGMVLPAVLAGGLFALATRPWLKACSPQRVAAAWALVGAGIIVAVGMSVGWPRWPLSRAEHTWCFIVAAGMLVALTRVQWLSAGVATLGVAWAISGGKTSVTVWAVAPVAAGVITLLAQRLSTQAGRELPLIVALCAGTVGMAVSMTGWDFGGRFGLGLAACLGAAGIVTLLLSCRASGLGLTSVAVPGYLVLIVCAYRYSELPHAAAWALAVAPLSGWLAEIPRVKRTTSPWVHALIRLAATGVILAAVMIPIARQFMQDMQGPAGGYG